MITKDEIKRLFELARIEYTQEDLEKFPLEINAILEYVAQLSSVELPAEAGATTVNTNELRADEVQGAGEKTLSLIKGAFPAREDDKLKTKKVFGD